MSKGLKQSDMENYTMRPVFHYAGYTVSAAPVGVKKDVLIQPFTFCQDAASIAVLSSGPFIGSILIDEILEYCNNKLAKLEEYDHANGTFLQETLLSYYMNGFNSAKTAEVLFIHRNSLNYRLKKIEELLELEINDYMEYLDILNCILVKRLMFI